MGGGSASKKTQEDNQNLFTLYNAVSQLATLAGIAKGKNVIAGELSAYNTQFQAGLQQVQSFINSTTFNNFTLQNQAPGSSVTSKVSIPFPPSSFTTGTIVSNADLEDPLPGVSASDSFNIAVTKGGTTTNVAIDLSQVQGPLTLDNITSYINQQLSAAGFATTFTRTMTSGTISDVAKASYGIAINPGVGETVSLSSAQAAPALYVAGTTGSTTTTPANAATGEPATPANNQGTLTKLTDLVDDAANRVQHHRDAQFGNDNGATNRGQLERQCLRRRQCDRKFRQRNQSGHAGRLSDKIRFAGNLLWTQLLGSSGTASGYSLALNPQGGVVVAGSTTAPLTTTSVVNGNTSSFVAAYDANGNQTWVQQLQTLNQNQANAVTVDSSGNVYVGGSVTGKLAAGQTSSGGTNSYITEIDDTGKIVSEQQYGPSAKLGRSAGDHIRWWARRGIPAEWRCHSDEIRQW